MKTERELFVKYMISENPSNNIEFMCEFGWFFDPITELRWQAWQASAQRDGYKLVPICRHEWSIQLSGRFICDLCGDFNEFAKP